MSAGGLRSGLLFRRILVGLAQLADLVGHIGQRDRDGQRSQREVAGRIRLDICLFRSPSVDYLMTSPMMGIPIPWFTTIS